MNKSDMTKKMDPIILLGKGHFFNLTSVYQFIKH